MRDWTAPGPNLLTQGPKKFGNAAAEIAKLERSTLSGRENF